MTGAALALALALLVAPAPRRRLGPPREGVTARQKTAVVLISAGAAAIALVLVVPPSVAIAAGIVAATLALRRRRRLTQRRRSAESLCLQGALDVLVGELRAGAHPVTAFSVAAAESGGAVGAALSAVAARARLGADVAAGLRSVADRSPVPTHWHRLAVCWQLAQAQGLAIATVMATAQHDIAERHRFASRVSAGMAGARTTAAVLAGLPVLGIGLGQLIGADPLGFLFAGGVGGWLLVVGVILAGAGLLWSDRITAEVVT